MEKILKKLKKLLRLIFGRTTLGTLFLLIQILVLFAGFNWFREYLIYMYGGSAILSALILIYIISDEGNSTIKLSWVVPILVFPVFGTLFYLFLTLQPGTHRINRRIEEVKGFVSEEELADLYRNCRIVVVPLRYGAGVKGKVVEAIYNGAPIVTTSVGSEGIPDVEKVLLVKDQPDEFAETVIELYNDEKRLEDLAEKTQVYIREHFSIDAAWDVIKEDFE